MAARVSTRWRPRRKFRKALKYRGKRRGGKKGGKMGYFRLVRRAPENTITNSSVANAPSGTGSVVAFGTAAATSFAGYYNIPGVAAFRLNDILNSSDITNLFDKYRLAWIKIKIYCTSSTAAVTTTAQLPSIIYSLDEDDATFPTVASMREKMGAVQRMFYPGKPITIFIRSPRVQRQLDTAALLSSGNEIARAPWINCSYDSVPHYGIKFCLLDANLNTTATANTQFKFDITYCIECKDAQ